MKDAGNSLARDGARVIPRLSVQCATTMLPWLGFDSQHTPPLLNTVSLQCFYPLNGLRVYVLCVHVLKDKRWSDDAHLRHVSQLFPVGHVFPCRVPTSFSSPLVTCHPCFSVDLHQPVSGGLPEQRQSNKLNNTLLMTAGCRFGSNWMECVFVCAWSGETKRPCMPDGSSRQPVCASPQQFSRRKRNWCVNE